MDNRPIGIFDSGVGGLTVAKQVIKALPEENIIYFGDTARVPYGSKSKETVTKFSEQIIRFLLTKDVKAVVIACNTVSSNCYEILQREFPSLPIIEVVRPGVESTLEVTKNNRVGLLATEATVASGAYERLLKAENDAIQVFSKPCPLFVPLAEEGWTDNDVTEKTAKIYLAEIMEQGIDSLILGCTHYPMLKACIGRIVGEKVTIVDPAKETAHKLKKYLEEHNMLCGRSAGESTRSFYLSDANKKFDEICNRVLHKECTAQQIDIEKF